MCDSEIECTLLRIAGIRTQLTFNLLPEKSKLRYQKNLEIFAIGATVAPPQVPPQ
jgi:hypothetical protein